MNGCWKVNGFREIIKNVDKTKEITRLLGMECCDCRCRWQVKSGKINVKGGKWKVKSEKWEVKSGKWEVESEKWKVGSGKWEVGSGKCKTGI